MKSNLPFHTLDPKKWSQEETEEHQASLHGSNTCYYCYRFKKKNGPIIRLAKLLAEAEGCMWNGKKIKMAESVNEARRLIDSGSVRFESCSIHKKMKGDCSKFHTGWDKWQPIKEFPTEEGFFRIGSSPSNLRFITLRFTEIKFKRLYWLEFKATVAEFYTNYIKPYLQGD